MKLQFPGLFDSISSGCLCIDTQKAKNILFSLLITRETEYKLNKNASGENKDQVEVHLL